MDTTKLQSIDTFQTTCSDNGKHKIDIIKFGPIQLLEEVHNHFLRLVYVTYII